MKKFLITAGIMAVISGLFTYGFSGMMKDYRSENSTAVTITGEEEMAEIIDKDGVYFAKGTLKGKTDVETPIRDILDGEPWDIVTGVETKRQAEDISRELHSLPDLLTIKVEKGKNTRDNYNQYRFIKESSETYVPETVEILGQAFPAHRLLIPERHLTELEDVTEKFMLRPEEETDFPVFRTLVVKSPLEGYLRFRVEDGKIVKEDSTYLTEQEYQATMEGAKHPEGMGTGPIVLLFFIIWVIGTLIVWSIVRHFFDE